MVARVLTLLLLLGAVGGCAQQPVVADRPQYMTADERVPYIKDFEASCLVRQRTGALSKHLSEEQRAQYCSCAAARSAETITLEEIGTMLRTGNRETIKPHLDAVQKYCSEKLMRMWVPK